MQASGPTRQVSAHSPTAAAQAAALYQGQSEGCSPPDRRSMLTLRVTGLVWLGSLIVVSPLLACGAWWTVERASARPAVALGPAAGRADADRHAVGDVDRQLDHLVRL